MPPRLSGREWALGCEPREDDREPDAIVIVCGAAAAAYPYASAPVAGASAAAPVAAAMGPECEFPVDTSTAFLPYGLWRKAVAEDERELCSLPRDGLPRVCAEEEECCGSSYIGSSSGDPGLGD